MLNFDLHSFIALTGFWSRDIQLTLHVVIKGIYYCANGRVSALRLLC